VTSSAKGHCERDDDKDCDKDGERHHHKPGENRGNDDRKKDGGL